jgi:hypothetical protein
MAGVLVEHRPPARLAVGRFFACRLARDPGWSDT